MPIYYNKKPKTKLKNSACYVNGIKFDSKKEAARYLTLLALERSHEISDLQMQVKFELIPSQREPSTFNSKGKEIKGKVIERSLDYIADFVYKTKDGETVVEDVKGYRNPASAPYAKFVIKRKLMLYVHGIRIKEV